MECFIPTSKKQHSPPKLTEKTYSNSQNVSWNCIRVLCFLSFIFPIYNLMWCLIPACAILCWLLYLLYFNICLNVWYVVWHIFRFVCQLNWQILKNKQTQTNKQTNTVRLWGFGQGRVVSSWGLPGHWSVGSELLLCTSFVLHIYYYHYCYFSLLFLTLSPSSTFSNSLPHPMEKRDGESKQRAV